MCNVIPAAQVNLPNSLSAGRLARRFLEEHWCSAHDSADLDQARLLVTELVINAVEHGGPPIVVEVECTGSDGVTIKVSDGGAAVPEPRDSPLHAEDGRGVQLMDVLAQEWGVEHYAPDADHHGDHAQPADHAHHADRTQGAGQAHPVIDLDTATSSSLDRRQFDDGPVAKTVWCHLVAA